MEKQPSLPNVYITQGEKPKFEFKIKEGVFLERLKQRMKRSHLFNKVKNINKKAELAQRIPKLRLDTEKIRNFDTVDLENSSKINSLTEKLYGKDYLKKFQEIQSVASQKSLTNNNPFDKTKYLSPESLRSFYTKYKVLNSVNRRDPIHNLSPSLAFISTSCKEKILPNPIGILKVKDKIDLNNKKLGDPYITAISSSLKISEEPLKEISLSSNRLSSVGANNIINAINSNIFINSTLKKIDFSDNKIGSDFTKGFLALITRKECIIEDLNLENILMNSYDIMKICDAISQSNLVEHLVCINLASNNLKDVCINSICSLITSCERLRVLILRNNNFTNKGMSYLMKSISTQKELRILDISWNKIGDALTCEIEPPQSVSLTERNDLRNEKNKYYNYEINQIQKFMKFDVLGSLKTKKISTKISPFALEFSKCISEKTCSLIHVDISHNNINCVDSEEIANKIKENRTIIGIHVDGNSMSVDSLGFIHLQKSTFIRQKSSSHIYPLSLSTESGTNVSNNHSSMSRSNSEVMRKVRSCSNCWICEGWRECDFMYSCKDTSRKIMIHFEFEGYKEQEMIFNTTHNEFSLVKMCPPGLIKYFITDNGIPITTFEYENDDGTCKERVELMNKKVARITVAKRIVRFNSNVIDSVDYKKNLKFCEIRPKPLEQDKENSLEREKWTFDLSIWKNKFSISDSDSFIDSTRLSKAFNFDFLRNHFEKDFQSNEELIRLKELLRENYRNLLIFYKHLCSLSGYSLPQITQNILSDFVIKCGIVDNNYTVNNCFLVMKSICSNGIDKDSRNDGNKNIPTDGLIRHQFLGFIVKVAVNKVVNFNKSRKSLFSLIEGTIQSITNNISTSNYDPDKFRREKYYTEEVDNFIKAFYVIFEGLFKSFAKQKSPSKNSPLYMTLEEFNTLTSTIVNVYDYPIRENTEIFNVSIRLQEDEIGSDRFLQMMFDEFIEALWRVADLANAVPEGENINDWDFKKRQSQSIVAKMENLLHEMIKGISHKDYLYIKDKFEFPIKDQRTDLYILEK